MKWMSPLVAGSVRQHRASHSPNYMLRFYSKLRRKLGRYDHPGPKRGGVASTQSPQLDNHKRCESGLGEISRDLLPLKSIKFGASKKIVLGFH